MVDLLVLGITIHQKEQVPLVLLNPVDSDTVLSVAISPAEAFAVTTAMQTNSAISCFNDSGDFFPEIFTRADSEKASPLLPHPAAPGRTPASDRGIRSLAEEDLENRLRQHDFFLQTIKALKGKVVAVELHAKGGEPLRAEAVVAGRELLRLPCTPADGIALALRTGASLVATREVRATSIAIDEIIEILPEQTQRLLRAALVSPHRMPTDGAARKKGTPSLAEEMPGQLVEKVQGSRQSPVIRVSVVRKRIVDGREVEELMPVPGAVTLKRVKGPQTEEERLAEMLARMVPETHTLM
jgi:Uncharacterised ACR, COG1259.